MLAPPLSILRLASQGATLSGPIKARCGTTPHHTAHLQVKLRSLAVIEQLRPEQHCLSNSSSTWKHGRQSPGLGMGALPLFGRNRANCRCHALPQGGGHPAKQGRAPVRGLAATGRSRRRRQAGARNSRGTAAAAFMHGCVMPCRT